MQCLKWPCPEHLSAILCGVINEITARESDVYLQNAWSANNFLIRGDVIRTSQHKTTWCTWVKALERREPGQLTHTMSNSFVKPLAVTITFDKMRLLFLFSRTKIDLSVKPIFRNFPRENTDSRFFKAATCFICQRVYTETTWFRCANSRHCCQLQTAKWGIHHS